MTAVGEKGLGTTQNVGSEKPRWAVSGRRGQITSVCMQSTDGHPKEEQVKGPHSAIGKVQDVGTVGQTTCFLQINCKKQERRGRETYRAVVLKVGPQ